MSESTSLGHGHVPFVQIPEWVLALPAPAVKLYALLAARADWDTKECRRKQATLAEDMGLSRSQVSRLVKELEDARAISVEHTRRQNGHNGACVYHVHWLPLPEGEEWPQDTLAPCSTDATLQSRTDATAVSRPSSRTSLDVVRKTSSSSRRPDLLWEELETWLGPAVTASERGKRNKALKEIRKAHPALNDDQLLIQLRRRIEVYWPDVTRSAMGLAANWGMLGQTASPEHLDDRNPSPLLEREGPEPELTAEEREQRRQMIRQAAIDAGFTPSDA